MDLIARLKENPYLAALSPADLESLAEVAVVRQYADGEVIFREGERADGVHFVLDGEVAITRSTSHQVHRAATLGPGVLFGMVAFLYVAPRSATATATRASTVAMIPKEAVGLLLNQSAPIAYQFQRAVAGQLARDLRDSDARLRELLARATRHSPPPAAR